MSRRTDKLRKDAKGHAKTSAKAGASSMSSDVRIEQDWNGHRFAFDQSSSTRVGSAIAHPSRPLFITWIVRAMWLNSAARSSGG